MYRIEWGLFWRRLNKFRWLNEFFVFYCTIWTISVFICDRVYLMYKVYYYFMYFFICLLTWKLIIGNSDTICIEDWSKLFPFLSISLCMCVRVRMRIKYIIFELECVTKLTAYEFFTEVSLVKFWPFGTWFHYTGSCIICSVCNRPLHRIRRNASKMATAFCPHVAVLRSLAL